MPDEGEGPREVYWIFDFTGLPESPGATSTFDYTCQAIWRYQPLVDKDISKMASTVKVEWRPHAYWISNGHHFSEGFGDTLHASAPVVLDNAVDAKDVPPSIIGVATKTKGPSA